MNFFKNLSKILLISIFSLPFISNAQSNYKPGYVVSLKGDTLKGFINYREWNKNPKQVSFKINLSDSRTQDFDVKNATGFAVVGAEYYERHIVKVSMDPVDVSAVTAKTDSNFVTDTVFLHALVKGKYVSLYSYTDDLKFRFYLSETGDTQQPLELAYHAYYDADQSNSIQYVTRYRTQLRYIAQKNGVSNSGIETLISQAKYNEDDLTRIVSKINGSSGQRLAGQSTFGTRWVAGLNVSDNVFKTEGVIEAPAGRSLLPQVFFGVDFMPNKNTQQLILRAGLVLSGGHYSVSNNDANPPFSLSLTQYTVSVVPQFIFNCYNTDNVKIFIDGGLSFNLSHYGDYGVRYHYSNSSENAIKGYPPLAKAWVSIPLKAGVLLNKKIEIYAGYIPVSNLSTIPDLTSTLTTYQAGVNYLFGAK